MFANQLNNTLVTFSLFLADASTKPFSQSTFTTDSVVSKSIWNKVKNCYRLITNYNQSWKKRKTFNIQSGKWMNADMNRIKRRFQITCVIFSVRMTKSELCKVPNSTCTALSHFVNGFLIRCIKRRIITSKINREPHGEDSIVVVVTMQQWNKSSQ